MAHSIEIESSVKKYLFSLDVKLRRRIMQSIDGLSLTPRPPGSKKLKSRDAYRIRVGDYRVVYEVHDDTLIVLVVRAAHRNEVYR